MNLQARDQPPGRWRVPALLGPALVGLVLAGCSSTPSTTAGPSSSSAAVTATTQATAAGSAAGAVSTQAFCQQYAGFVNTLSGNIVTRDGFAQFKQGYAALAANAPSAIRTDMASLSAQAQAMQSAQDVTSVTIGTAQNDVDNWVKSNCPDFSATIGAGAQPTSSATTK